MDIGLSGGLYKSCVWLMRLAYINVLWIFFSLVGFIFGGFFPATVAMFSIERKWIRGQGEVLQLFSTFWLEYKKVFLKSNILGYSLTIFGFLLFINYRLIISVDTPIADFFYVLLLAIFFLYVIVCIYIFPVYTHYNVKFFDTLKYAFFIGLSSPLMTLLIGLSILFFFYLSSILPGIIPVFIGSCVSFITMWFAHCAFVRIEQKIPKVN